MRAEALLRAHHEDIAALCRRFGVRRLRLFGSALRKDWDPATSDFDFLAEFEPPTGMSAFDQFFGFALELQRQLGHEVDLVDWNAARNPLFRQAVEGSARLVYAA